MNNKVLLGVLVTGLLVFVAFFGSPEKGPQELAEAQSLAEQPCSASLYDSYTTSGPDGQAYATWHPRIQTDGPEAGCSFGHEHGSDPSNFRAGYKPTMGYVGAKHGMIEAHTGFKNFNFRSNGYKWQFLVHLGTSGQGRVCNRYHETNIKVAKEDTGEIVADYRFMGDYGVARPFEDNTQRLTPDACPNQGLNADGTPITTAGSRRIATEALADPKKPYEPWRFDMTTNRTAFGFAKNAVPGATSIPSLTHNTFVTQCKDVDCNELVLTGEMGALRTIDMAGFTIDASKAQATGYFYTDPLGKTLRGGTESDAIKQYVKPGLFAKVEGCDDDTNPFSNREPKTNAAYGPDSEYVCGNKFIDMDPEDSLKSPN